MSVPNFMAIHLIFVEIFQSVPKWWTDITIPRSCAGKVDNKTEAEESEESNMYNIKYG